jgi:hypothetical protein
VLIISQIWERSVIFPKYDVLNLVFPKEGGVSIIYPTFFVHFANRNLSHDYFIIKKKNHYYKPKYNARDKFLLTKLTIILKKSISPI